MCTICGSIDSESCGQCRLGDRVLTYYRGPMNRLSAVMNVALLLGTVTSARADEATPPAAPAPEAETTLLNYVVVAATTTLFHKPNSGSSSGWQEDIGPVVGYGRYVTDTIALELALGPSFARSSGYTGFFLVPSVAWSFSTHVYAAAHFLVESDPQLDLALSLSVGGVYSFEDQISLTLELNLESFLGRGDPDFAVAVTPGIAYSF
jgi:hypothetical protein